jgi:hypothetical protein
VSRGRAKSGSIFRLSRKSTLGNKGSIGKISTFEVDFLGLSGHECSFLEQGQRRKFTFVCMETFYRTSVPRKGSRSNNVPARM